MSRKLPPRNPRAAYRRKTLAARRAGIDAKCACGESRPQCLISGANPPRCAKCDRKRRNQSTSDQHHVFSKANSPLTISIPVNDHREFFNEAQNDWPPRILENPEKSPLLTAAAFIRGFADLIVYLMKNFLLRIAEMLERLDTMEMKKLPKDRWKHMKLEPFDSK